MVPTAAGAGQVFFQRHSRLRSFAGRRHIAEDCPPLPNQNRESLRALA